MLLLAAPLGAQVAPYLHWETIRTEHFRVHFAPGLEYTARRAAGSGERAYEKLAEELVPPRGPIDMAVADNEDISNGFTTTFPTNRIIIFARPTVDATALKFLDDWIDLVVSHELTHVFHLDRSRGWWRVGQWVFGRNPFLFPNQYSPSWLSEGIAVYFESRLTGAGRIEGTDDATILRTLAMDNRTPRLNALSAATLRYPLGESVYAYGALLVEHLARSQGREKMRDFIEISAARTIPFLVNRNARAAFGISFDSAYQLLIDSVKRDATAAQTRTAPGLRTLTTQGWYAQRLRWADSTHIIYGSNDGRSITGIREVSATGGEPRFLERRNSLDITSPLPNGARVFSQLDFTDPWTLRADLYYEEKGQITRLTNGERIMQPDAKLSRGAAASGAPASSGDVHGQPVTAGASGAPASGGSAQIDVVAVQIVPGASRLVRVTVEDPSTLDRRSTRVSFSTAARIHISPLTSSHPDTIWSEPRFSHDGTRIAVTRWLRNAMSEIVILDSSGKALRVVGRSHSVNGSPSWAKGDSAIFFTSDRSGRPELYRASLSSRSLERIATVGTGLLESEQSPDGAELATLLFRGDGYHVAVMPVPRRGLAEADSTSVLRPSRRDTLVTSSAPARPYAAWPSILPRYWLPAIERTSDKLTSFGFITSGSDILSRHTYDAIVTYEPQRKEPTLNLAYEFTGFGNPVLDVSGIQEWDHFGNISRISGTDTVRVGTLRRRRRFLDVQFTELRPRVRTNASVSLGAAVEFDDYRSDPAPLFDGLTAASRARYTARAYPSVFASAAWSNAQRPTLAISPEDGIQVALTARRRWRADSASGTGSNSVVGILAAYKSLDLPGFAHHVLAVRAAAGWADEKATNEFDAGGVSGDQLTIAPGVALGNGRRTFPVRGFDASSQQGIRALGGSVEYRLPLLLPSSGFGSLPLFVQRVSAVGFADAATSWCPSGIAGSIVCPSQGIAKDWMASAGGELQLEAAYNYDVPYRFRVGTAAPVAGRKYFGTGSVAVYFAVGLAF